MKLTAKTQREGRNILDHGNLAMTVYPEAIWIICPIRLSAVFNSVEKNCPFISAALNLVSDYQSQNNDVMDVTNFAGMQVINSFADRKRSQIWN